MIDSKSFANPDERIAELERLKRRETQKQFFAKVDRVAELSKEIEYLEKRKAEKQQQIRAKHDRVLAAWKGNRVYGQYVKDLKLAEETDDLNLQGTIQCSKCSRWIRFFVFDLHLSTAHYVGIKMGQLHAKIAKEEEERAEKERLADLNYRRTRAAAAEQA
jgi:hypothetical protein